MAVASKKEILDHLDSIDLNELFDRMENYVRSRFYDKSKNQKDGFDYMDFCNDVLVKALTGVRKWNMENVSFEDFIFGALKSDLYNFFRKQKNNQDNLQSSEQEIYLIEVNDFIALDEIATEDEPPDIDFEDISQDVIKSLTEQGAKKLEIDIFECWLSGYYKPKEIAELCGTSTTEINNSVKTLSRKTIKLKEKWISLKK
jgi:RNA polymerase sporulation-specific sigma factor